MKSILLTVGCYYFCLPRLSAPSICPRQNKDLEMPLPEKPEQVLFSPAIVSIQKKMGRPIVAAPRAANLLGYSDWSPSLS